MEGENGFIWSLTKRDRFAFFLIVNGVLVGNRIFKCEKGLFLVAIVNKINIITQGAWTMQSSCRETTNS